MKSFANITYKINYNKILGKLSVLFSLLFFSNAYSNSYDSLFYVQQKKETPVLIFISKETLVTGIYKKNNRKETINNRKETIRQIANKRKIKKSPEIFNKKKKNFNQKLKRKDKIKYSRNNKNKTCLNSYISKATIISNNFWFVKTILKRQLYISDISYDFDFIKNLTIKKLNIILKNIYKTSTAIRPPPTIATFNLIPTPH